MHAAVSQHAIAGRPLQIAHRAAKAASAVPSGAVLQSVAASAVLKEVPEAQREPALRRGQTLSGAPAPASQLRRTGESAQRGPAVPIARSALSAPIVPQVAARSEEASAKADRHVPVVAASHPKSRFRASPLATARPAPAKVVRIARAFARQLAQGHRNPDHRDSARTVPAVPRAMASGRSAALAVAKAVPSASPLATGRPAVVKAVPTAPSVSRRGIVRQAASAVPRVAMVSHARHFVVVNRAHPSAEGSRVRKGIAPSNGPMHLPAIVLPGADPRAATESPAAAAVPSASSPPDHGLRAGLRAASGNPGPSALPVSGPAAPVDSSPQAVPGNLASPQAASESPASANPALPNLAAIASPQATGQQPAAIVQPPAGIVQIARALPSLQESVLPVPQGAMQLPARASLEASANPAVPASPSANLARLALAHVGLVPQEQGRVAPRPPPAPASRAVPADSANRVQAHRPVVRPPREASGTSSHVASPWVPSARARNVPGVRERLNANRPVPNRAVKETKASGRTFNQATHRCPFDRHY